MKNMYTYIKCNFLLFNKTCLFIMIIFICLIFGSCKQNRNSNSGSRNILDMAGRTVAVPETVNRVFMDWVQGTLHMMTLGALDKVVVVRTALEGEIFTWARTIYPSFDTIPKDDAPFTNIEALLTYEPDVIFTLYEDNAKTYASVGIPAVVVTFNDYNQFLQAMQIIGDVLGVDYADKASRFNDFFNANIIMVTDRLADVNDKEKMNIHYVAGRANSALFTQGRDQIEATWVELAGGKYAAYEFTGRAIELSMEKLLVFDPDIIFVGGHQQAASFRILMNDNILSNMRAVRDGNVFRIPLGIFPWSEMGPEASMQMVWAAKTLYPERFFDIDISHMAKSFYHDFLGSDVPDDIIIKMLEGRLTLTGE